MEEEEEEEERQCQQFRWNGNESTVLEANENADGDDKSEIGYTVAKNDNS
jgi:hypothetical protein